MNKLAFTNPIYVTRPLLPDLKDLMARLQEVWDSQWLTNFGAQHKLLEQRLTKLLKVQNVSLFNNGTIALITACQSLRLSGEVITTPFTFAATPHVLTWNGIKPIFCDINPETMNIDETKIESMITPETTGILGVHVFGVPCNVKVIQDIADRYGLKVIYDAAHAFQCEINDIGIGNFGDITMFSFHATKLFHTGEGGALTFKDHNLKQRLDLLKNFGIKNEEEVVMPGINGKMNEIQAALGLAVLDILNEEHIKRERLLEVYREQLSDVDGITFQKELKSVTQSSNQYFVIRINENRFGTSRNTVHDRLKKYNVIARKYFYPLCSDYTCYRHLPSSKKENLPVANMVVNETLALPLYGRLTEDDVIKICDIIKQESPSIPAPHGGL
ncbi:MAG: DegT/DnrJ/EryC1/StrS family aminotransferase [Candidatus Ratteibacteria bacterium]|nr:DegT/DnrJ/EryC1/StrS family aminotransferase [Candidatus Ratteibacteria bacterium]